MENLVKPGRGVFIPDKYTERGKWMDGWESRRKRVAGHDWCVLRLGVPGSISVFDIDTNHFLGNHPSFAMIEGCFAPDAPQDAASLEALPWKPLLAPVSLQRGSQNLFATQHLDAITHIKLHIYPDGGVARLRAYGRPMSLWKRNEDDERFPLQEGEVDLAAMRNGGETLLCSDMFFGVMSNLIAPGRARVMGEGWETRRSRRPGYDWIIVKLGAVGDISFVVVDTNHFKGNYPESFSLEGIYAPDLQMTDLQENEAMPWKEILSRRPLQEHHEHLFREEIQEKGAFSHVKLKIYPDGGVSRLRIYGHRSS
jgi:allantoicase